MPRLYSGWLRVPTVPTALATAKSGHCADTCARASVHAIYVLEPGCVRGCGVTTCTKLFYANCTQLFSCTDIDAPQRLFFHYTRRHPTASARARSQLKVRMMERLPARVIFRPRPGWLSPDDPERSRRRARVLLCERGLGVGRRCFCFFFSVFFSRFLSRLSFFSAFFLSSFGSVFSAPFFSISPATTTAACGAGACVDPAARAGVLAARAGALAARVGGFSSFFSPLRGGA